MAQINKIASSYRDPSGFVFLFAEEIYRQINHSYKDNYDLLMQSGLYQQLVQEGDLIAHGEVDLNIQDPNMYKVIKPRQIPFISYPYEWSFSQLKDAALLTLKIQKKALSFGLTLKDASAYNIQFLDGKPIFIDTLSFEKYKVGNPWLAYKQFCEHFLAPLALLAYTDERLARLSQIYIDGIPLDLATKILPGKIRLKPFLFIHIYLHSLKQRQYSDHNILTEKKVKLGDSAITALIDNLESSVKNIKLKHKKTTWSDYSSDDHCESYEDVAMQAKKEYVSEFLDLAQAKEIWDLGSNTGLYSRIAARKGIAVISMDFDEMAVERNYLNVKKNNEKNILPLIMDLINPSPDIGWHNQERLALLSRHLPDTVLALALVHHLAISKNLPFYKISEFLVAISKKLIIEFVPKEDKQTQRLLRNREDIFNEYNQEEFERIFSLMFDIKEKKEIPNSKRILYLMVAKN